MRNCARCGASLDQHNQSECMADSTMVGCAVESSELAKHTRALDEMTGRLKLFPNLCLLLHLDPALATADDVLRLVGECVTRATEAERKTCGGCMNWRASLSGDPSGFCERTESGYIMRPTDYCSRWEERR